MGKSIRNRFGKSDRPDAEKARIGMHYARGPSARTQDPLETFQRFDLSGHDYKGQLSSGYGQHGYGLSVAVSADLGTFVMPGIVRLPVSLGLEAEGARQTVLVLVRFPRSIASKSFLHRDLIDEARAAPPGTYDRRTERRLAALPPDRPRTTWSSSRPLVMMTMRGGRGQLEVGFGAGAAVGLGNPLVPKDELSVTAAVAVQGEVSGTLSTTTMVDDQPRSYQSAYPPDGPGDLSVDEVENLSAYVNHELEADVKRRIVAWMAIKGGDAATGTAVRGLSSANDAIGWAVDRWADSQHHPNWDADPSGLFSAFGGIFHTRPSTDELVEKLDRLAVDLPVAMRAAGPMTKTQATVLASDLATIADLRHRLYMRRTRKRLRLSSTPPRPVGQHRTPAADGAIGYLQIGSREFSATGSGALSVKLGVGATASLAGSHVGRHIGIQFQAVSLPPGGQAPLVFSQHTEFVQRLRTVTKVTGLTGVEKGSVDEVTHYGTATYQSACAYWLDEPGPATAGDRTATAQVNGSGVSRGVSIQAHDIDRYATALQAGTASAGDAKDVEETLVSLLGVNALHLRRFFTTYVHIGAISPDARLGDTSVLVEAGFSLKEPATIRLHTPGASRRRPRNLLDTTWARDRLAEGPSSTVGATSDLSALRVRYRIRRDEDLTRSLFTFGWATPTSDFDAKGRLLTPLEAFSSPVGVGGGPTRVERVGSEGIVDLHVRFFPDPQPPLNVHGYELAVPGVALFSQ